MYNLLTILKAILHFIRGVSDYVVEEGTSGIWTYRKWASGVAECWGEQYFSSLNINTAFGNLYYCRLWSSLGLPNGLFVSDPQVDIYSRSTNADVFHGTYVTTKDEIGITNAWSTRANTGYAVRVFISVRGKWK